MSLKQPGFKFIWKLTLTLTPGVEKPDVKITIPQLTLDRPVKEEVRDEIAKILQECFTLDVLTFSQHSSEEDIYRDISELPPELI